MDEEGLKNASSYFQAKELNNNFCEKMNLMVQPFRYEYIIHLSQL